MNNRMGALVIGAAAVVIVGLSGCAASDAGDLTRTNEGQSLVQVPEATAHPTFTDTDTSSAGLTLATAKAACKQKAIDTWDDGSTIDAADFTKVKSNGDGWSVEGTFDVDDTTVGKVRRAFECNVAGTEAAPDANGRFSYPAS